jgi:hypothetical protein
MGEENFLVPLVPSGRGRGELNSPSVVYVYKLKTKIKGYVLICFIWFVNKEKIVSQNNMIY